VVKELSSRLEEFVVPDETRELSARLTGTGVEECWMEIDGARMRYLRAGSGPALILLHGLLGYSFSWRFTIPALAPYATVYAPDMLGAGFSDRPVGLAYNMRAVTERLLKFIRRLAISSFDLLGTSHGGAVAILAAAECQRTQSPLKLRRLILVAPVNPYSSHGQRLAPFFASPIGAALFRVAVTRMSFVRRLALVRLYGNRKRIPAGTLEGYTAPLAKPGLIEHALSIARTWAADLREIEAALPKLASIPTLLLWGSEDPAVYASSAERLAQYFPKSRTIIFPGIGHLPYEECPEEFNRALIGFLTSQKFSA
jgi:pimeloyl-ACP methyl ester carboxylesterase